MEKPTCGIIQDLLISYCDGLSGENIVAMIQEHLEGCPKCSQRFEEIRKQREQTEKEEASRGKSFGEKLKSLRIYMLGTVIGFMLPIAGILAWYLISSIISFIQVMFFSYFM